EGAYGISNFGDDLLLAICLDFFQVHGHKAIVAGRLPRDDKPETSSITVGRLAIFHKFLEIMRSDMVVIGGGGQFNDNSSRTGGAHLVLTFLLSMLLRKPITVLATGFGPLTKKFPRWIWTVLGRYGNASFLFREVK